MENLERNRDFKGVWIPKEIWLDENLTVIEKVILVEIDSLDNEDHCVASNDYLAEFCQCSEGKVSAAVKKLVELGYIEVVSFDGRHRRLKSCYKGKVFEPTPKAEKPKKAEIYNRKREVPEELKPEVKPVKEEKAKKVSRKDQLTEYVNRLDFNMDTKDNLFKWIFNIGLPKGITLEQLKDKLKSLDDLCNGDENLMSESFKTSYLNNYFAFYKPNNNQTNKKQSQANTEATKYYANQIKNQSSEDRTQAQADRRAFYNSGRENTTTVSSNTVNFRRADGSVVALSDELF